MAEYVDKKDAIRAIVKTATRFCRDVELVAHIIHDIETLPAADVIEELTCENESLAKSVNEASEILRRRWIPVTERLPKADEYDARGYAVPYLVMNGWMRVTARRTNDYWVLFGEGTVLEYVTHWMPLPEPPKEE